MSSEHLASAQNQLKGNLAGAWDILSGAQGQYQDLGIARRFGGAAAAYSLRDIGAIGNRTIYNAVVKVRRDSDDTTQDFSANQVATGQVEVFVGSGNSGFVDTWYDQSGNKKDCTMPNTSLQPFIVDSGTFTGVFMKEISGGSEPNSRNLRIDDIQTTDLGNNFGLIWVGKIDGAYTENQGSTLVGANRNLSTRNTGTIGLNTLIGSESFNISNETGAGASAQVKASATISYTLGDRISVAGTCVGPDGDGDHTLKAYVNGATPVSNNDTLVLTDSGDDLRIMASNFSNTVRRDRSTIGKVDEVIIFASNIEPDMEEVRADINNYYNIY